MTSIFHKDYEQTLSQMFACYKLYVEYINQEEAENYIAEHPKEWELFLLGVSIGRKLGPTRVPSYGSPV